MTSDNCEPTLEDKILAYSVILCISTFSYLIGNYNMLTSFAFGNFWIQTELDLLNGIILIIGICTFMLVIIGSILQSFDNNT